MKKYNLILNAIFDSGEILMKGLKKERVFSLKHKQHQNYLTKFDSLIDKKIVSSIEKTFPHDNIWSEEGGIKKGDNDYTWYIDPLSNTRNYIHGLPGFSIAVGLVRNGKPVLGFVYDPWLKELFTGEVGKGAKLNGKPIKVSTFKFGEHAFINVDWQKRKTMKEIEEGIELFSKIGRYCTVRAVGSVALTACYVASGRLDAMLNNYSDLHALVPAWIILREAGGEILDLNGKKWSLNSVSTFVTNKKVTRKLLKCLEK